MKKINILLSSVVLGFIFLFIGYILLGFAFKQAYLLILFADLILLVVISRLFYLVKRRDNAIYENKVLEKTIHYKETHESLSKLPVSLILMIIYLGYIVFDFTLNLIYFIKG